MNEMLRKVIFAIFIFMTVFMMFSMKSYNDVLGSLNKLDNKIYKLEEKLSKMTPEEHQTVYIIRQEEPEDIEEVIEDLNLGNFKLTAYCPCKKCCGEYSYEVTGKRNKTSSGTYPVAQKTVAADINILPIGSKILINGQEYIVEDTGSKVKGKHIDIYFDNHQEALRSGLTEGEVILIRE